MAHPLVDADGNLAGKGAGGVAYQRGIFHRDGAEDHAGQAERQPALDRGHVADAAAQLGRHPGAFQDRLDRGGVDGFAREGTVQIDEVQPFAARLDKFHRLRGRVVVEDGGLFHVALEKTHGLAVLEVDSGVEDHREALVAA